MITLLLLAAVSQLDVFRLQHNRDPQQANLILETALSAKKRIRSTFGIDVPPTTIILCDNATQFTRITGQASPTVGVAYPSRRLVVLNAHADPLSAPLKSLMRHELFHIALHHFSTRTKAAVPLWLNEGLAQLTEGKELEPKIARFLRARAAAFLAVSLLKNRYPKDPTEKALFYAASLSFCRYLEKLGSWRTFFMLLAKGYRWQEALVGAFGTDLETLAQKWQTELAKTWSWLDVLGAIGLMGFVGILVLVSVFVFYFRYRRAKRALPDSDHPDWLT